MSCLLNIVIASAQDAIGEERYHDASKLCRQTGSGLVIFNILPVLCFAQFVISL